VNDVAATALRSRVRGSLEFDTGDPLVVLYGPGTADCFVDPDYCERSFDESLWDLLRRAGFGRIVFSSANEPVYRLDADSRTVPVGPGDGGGPGEPAGRLHAGT
jgi:hypothetical protein